MKELVIVDSGSANLYSIFKACEMISLNPKISDHPGVIAGARAVIFPGVGFFDHAAKGLQEKNLASALLEVIADKKPLLGICLGMQLLFTESEESTDSKSVTGGLNAIGGKVKRFPANLPVPHVGWNKVIPVTEHPLFDDICSETYFYFTHSYYVEPDQNRFTMALTEYGFSFTSAAADGNLMGVQFHPEKSGPAGLRLLSNFGKIIAENN